MKVPMVKHLCVSDDWLNGVKSWAKSWKVKSPGKALAPDRVLTTPLSSWGENLLGSQDDEYSYDVDDNNETDMNILSNAGDQDLWNKHTIDQ